MQLAAKEPLIQGVTIEPLCKISDDRGIVMHMLRADHPHFESFGEIYFSCIYPGVIKAWKLHKKMTLNYAIPVGMIKLVLYDDRAESSTRGQVMELLVGEDNYCLITIPPLVWNGFKGMGDKMAVVANCATLPYDQNEVERFGASDSRIPYDWALRHG
jgi:dTDP-4-dehydrorhamnose 3,5-epimerase